MVRLPSHPDPVVLTLTHRAHGHFVADGLDNRPHSRGQLVLAGGPFAGRFLGRASDARVRALRVQVDGPWNAGSARSPRPAGHAGPWQGEVPLPEPCLLHARADGPWSIGVRCR